MKHRFFGPVSGVSIFLGLACAPPNAAKPYPKPAAPESGSGVAQPVATAPGGQGQVRYFDRTIDLQPFLAGFPYGNFDADLKSGKMFFFEEGERYTLKMLDLNAAKDGPYDLAGAPAVSDVDWSARSLWGIHFHQPSNTLWLHADARNDEVMNLWTLSLDSGELQQVTQHDYIYSFGVSEDETQIAYLPRYGKKAPFEKTCLNVLEVASQTSREVLCDSKELKFTWSSIRFSPDNREVYFDAQIQGDRNRVQMVAVDLQAKQPKVRVLTDRKRSRNSPQILKGFIDGDGLLFLANDDGYRNLYSYSRKSQKIRQLTRFKEDITSAAITDAGVFAVHRTPRGSTLVIVDPRTGKVLGELKRPGTADVLDGYKGRVLWSQRAPDIYTELNLAHLEAGGAKQAPGLKNNRVVGLPEELSQQIVQCRAERVTIPTFDIDPDTGKKRELHAFVLHPKTPLQDPQKRLALITAFYGGGNRYSTFDNIMCAAGLTVISPAVRGSSGFGKKFYGLNDKDLGGDEIVDLFWVARWAEQNLGLKPQQIGVYGGSHGGYATMRALTFPPETNGRNDNYEFGFGLAHAGFSDIKSFYDATNIPDWVVLESGDPNKPAELSRMKDRSPLTHASRLKSPILLTHGSNDWRVPVGESQRFATAAKQLGRPVTYVEFPGQGHHIEGLELQMQLYQARFDFLSQVAAPAQTPAPRVGQ